jgi:hypothetical protein
MHLPQFLDIDWPVIMKDLFAVFKPLTFSLDMVRPECSVDLSPQQKLYAVLFVPICCCIAVALSKVCLVMFSLYRFNIRIKEMIPSSMQIHVSGGFRALLSCLIASSFGGKIRRESIADFGPLFFALNPLLFNRADWNVGSIATRHRRTAAPAIGSSFKKNVPINQTQSDSSYPEAWVELRKFFTDSELESIFMSNVLGLKKSASGALSVLILSFVGVMETALPILNCSGEITEDGTEKQLLRGDRSIECSLDNPIYRSLASMAAIGIFVYALIVPLVMHTVFRSRWSLRFYRLDYASHNSVFGFVTSRYKRDYLSWELLNHFKKGSQIAIPLYLAGQPVQQSVLLFFLNCIFSVAVLYTMPFSSKFLNVMEIMSSLDLLVTVIIGIFFVVEHKGQPVMSEAAKQFFGILLVVLCLVTLAASVWCILQELLFLAKLHKQSAISAWLQLFSGNAGDSIAANSLFSLFYPGIFNKTSSKSIVDFNSSIVQTGVCSWLKSLYARLKYQPDSGSVVAFLHEPVCELLKDMHRLIRRIGELRNVGIHAPKDTLDPRFHDTHGPGDPPYEVYKKVAEIDDILTKSLSPECNRYLLALLVADKFREKSQESVFTEAYWNRIVPNSQALLHAVSKVQPASTILMTMKPQQKGIFGRLYERISPNHSESMPMIAVLDTFNRMTSAEHADFVYSAGNFPDHDAGSTCDDSNGDDGNDLSCGVIDENHFPSGKINQTSDGHGAVAHVLAGDESSSLSSFSDDDVTQPVKSSLASVTVASAPSQSKLVLSALNLQPLPLTGQEKSSVVTNAAATPLAKVSLSGLAASAPPPSRRKPVPDSTTDSSPQAAPHASKPVDAVHHSAAAAKGAPTKSGLERPPQHDDPLFQPATQTASRLTASATPPRAPHAFISPSSLQRTNALNQPLTSSSQRQTKFVDRSAGARPRHVVLASAAELEDAIAVDIPVGDDHRHASFVFDWPAPTVPPPVAPRSSATDKLKALMAARRKA